MFTVTIKQWYKPKKIRTSTDSSNNVPVLITSKKNTRSLKIIKASKEIKTNIITMDIETISREGVMTPYCISISDGNTA